MFLDQPLTVETIAPHLLLLAGGVSIVMALVVAWVSQAHRRVGLVASVISLLSFFGALVVNQLAVSNGGMHFQSKHVGWISERAAHGGITLGYLADELAILFGIAVTVILALFSLARQERFGSRVIGLEVFTLLWGASGTILVCFSGTIWTGLFSLVILIVASSTALSEGWTHPKDAQILSRELFDRGTCLLLAMIGASLLSNYGEQLRFGQVSIDPVVTVGSKVGMFFLALGLIGQLRPVPFGGYASCLSEESKGATHLVIRAVMPSLATIILLIRLSPFLNAYRCAEATAVIAAAAGLLSLLSCLSQKEFRQTIGLLLPGAFTLSAAMISGGQVGAGLFTGFSFCVIVLAFLFLSNVPADFGKSAVFRGIVISGGLLGSGMTLGLGGAGFGDWLSRYSPQYSWEIAIRFTAYLLYAGAVWKAGFLLVPERNDKKLNWESQLIPGILVAASLAIWWLGAFVDPTAFGESVRLFGSLFEQSISTVPAAKIASETVLDRYLIEGAQAVLSVTFGLLLYWMIRRRKSNAQTIEKIFPKIFAFLRDGYRVDKVREASVVGVSRVASAMNEVIEEKFWLSAYPRFSMRTVRSVSRAVARNESVFTKFIEEQVARLVGVWAKFFQLVQSGDIQWYLFVGLMVAVAMLIRYLRT